uniref:Uncharacterized protein n=1 Tax=viral metagenome TaxID=1070528 RepID=A0A6C0B1Y8_9ZZZZ
MKTYRNRHTRNRTRRRRMKGGSYADDLALITKYVEIGSRDPLMPLDMRPSNAELDSIDRIVKGYPLSEELKDRFLSTIANIRRTTHRGVGYGQQVTRQLATRFAAEIGELKAVVEANRPAERQANNDFYIPLQRLHRIAFDFSNSLTPADQAKLVSNKSQYDTVNGHTDGKQPVDQEAANVELLSSVSRFIPQLGDWFTGLSRLKNVQIAARPAERERLFELLPPGLRGSDELAKIFDAYSVRIADVYVNLSTSVALGDQAALAKPERPRKPGRKDLEQEKAGPVPEPPIFGEPAPEERALPIELPEARPVPAVAALPEALPLGATPLQELPAPPARGIRARPSNALGAVPVVAEGMNLAGPVVNSLPLPSSEGPRDMAPRPKVNPVYVAPPGAERTPAPVIPDVSSTSRSGLLPRAPGAVPTQPVFPTVEQPASAPGRSALGQTASPGVLQSQSTPLTSGEQMQFLKGSYKLLQQRDPGTTICEYRYPTVYKLLESGIFNGSDIISLLNRNDPKLSELFTAIGYDRDAKTIMDHPIAEIYRACHPDRSLGDQENLTRIFQVLKALEDYTGQTQPVNNLENVDPDDESYWADDDPRWDQDDSSDFLKELMSYLKFPKTNVLSLDELLAMLRPTVDQAKLNEIQIQNRKDYIKNHIRKFMRETIEKCTDRALALRRESNMNKLLEFLVDGYPFRVSSVVVQQIKDVIHDKPGEGIIESKTLRFFLNSVVKVLQARNIQELNQRLIETKGVVHAIFYQEQWCAKPNVALDVKQEIYRGSLKAKWIDETRQGLTLTSDAIRPDKANGISSKTITISRGDCFSFNTEGVKTCAPKFVFKESKNHFTVENITEVPTGFSLSILQYLSGSVVRSSRFPILLAKSSDITCFVNGIVKKECPKGVGLTPQITLPNDCPKKLLDAQFKLVAAETKSRNLERQVTTCEAHVAKLRSELDKVLRENEAETTRLRADIARDQAKLAELEASKDVIDSQLAEVRAKRDEIQGHLHGFAVQLKESERVKAEVELEKARLEAQIGVLKSDKVQSDAQAELTARLNAERDAEVGRLTERYNTVSGQLQAASSEQGELQARYAEVQAQLLAAQASVADLDSRFATTNALIRTTDEQIREELGGITEIIGEGVEELTAGLDLVLGLANDTRNDIAAARSGFTEQFSALQHELAAAELSRKGEILQAIQSLKEENQARMAALQRDLAQASAEKDRLQAQLSQEQAAKAMAEGQVAAKNEEIAKKDREHAAALEAARKAAADTAEQVKAANDAALQSKDAESVATAAGLDVVYRGQLEVLRLQLAAALARSVAAEASVADRAGLEAELARIHEEIAARPIPAAPAAPVAVPVPEIINRVPGGNVVVGNEITINWDTHGSPAPWILRVDYDGANPDFQEVTNSAPIMYTVKRPGELMGTIYSVRVV